MNEKNEYTFPFLSQKWQRLEEKPNHQENHTWKIYQEANKRQWMRRIIKSFFYNYSSFEMPWDAKKC